LDEEAVLDPSFVTVAVSRVAGGWELAGVSLGSVGRNGTLDEEVPSLGPALSVPFALPISVTLIPVILILMSTAGKYVSSEMGSGIG
jgi:hypothetical protein